MANNDEIISLRREVSYVQENFTKLNAEVALMQKELQELREKNVALSKDTATLRAENARLRDDLATLEADTSRLHGEVTAVQVENTRQRVTRLENEVSSLHQLTVPEEVDVAELSKKLSAAEGNISSFRRSLAKASAMVSFQAILKEKITTTQEQVLIMDDVISNVGGAYDSETGIFTAPVTGIYLFLVTTGPNTTEESFPARVDVVLESKRIGYACSRHSRSFTGHAIVKVSAGHQVWLRTYNETCKFHNAWWTTFSGTLVQAEC